MLLSQLDDFDQDVTVGDAVSSESQNVVVNSGSVDREFTVNSNDDIPTTNENTVNVQTLEKCLNKMNDRELGNIVETVEDRIENDILTAIDIIITSRIVLAPRSINASSGRGTASVTANSERGEHIGITASFEKVPDRNSTFQELNENDETRGKISDEVSEFSVPWTHFEWQSHIHHSCNSQKS